MEVEAAQAGEIVALAGLEGISIGETLADPENPIALATDQGGRADGTHDIWREQLPIFWA